MTGYLSFAHDRENQSKLTFGQLFFSKLNMSPFCAISNSFDYTSIGKSHSLNSNDTTFSFCLCFNFALIKWFHSIIPGLAIIILFLLNSNVVIFFCCYFSKKKSISYVQYKFIWHTVYFLFFIYLPSYVTN